MSLNFTFTIYMVISKKIYLFIYLLLNLVSPAEVSKLNLNKSLSLSIYI